MVRLSDTWCQVRDVFSAPHGRWHLAVRRAALRRGMRLCVLVVNKSALNMRRNPGCIAIVISYDDKLKNHGISGFQILRHPGVACNIFRGIYILKTHGTADGRSQLPLVSVRTGTLPHHQQHHYHVAPWTPPASERSLFCTLVGWNLHCYRGQERFFIFSKNLRGASMAIRSLATALSQGTWVRQAVLQHARIPGQRLEWMENWCCLMCSPP